MYCGLTRGCYSHCIVVWIGGATSLYCGLARGCYSHCIVVVECYGQCTVARDATINALWLGVLRSICRGRCGQCVVVVGCCGQCVVWLGLYVNV